MRSDENTRSDFVYIRSIIISGINNDKNDDENKNETQKMFHALTVHAYWALRFTQGIFRYASVVAKVTVL